jgi:hypothetical protein
MSASNTARLKAAGGNPATSFYFVIDDLGRLVVQFDGTFGGKITRVIRSRRQFADFIRAKADEASVGVDHLGLVCSSTLDFPKEYTKDETVIDLCDYLRGRCA